jgi:aryl-alcohol dehydrogenase
MITEGLVVTEPGSPFIYQEISVDDSLRDDEILVEMKATGVCHTDLNFRNEKTIPGLHPAVFGHEGQKQSVSSLRVSPRCWNSPRENPNRSPI